MKTKRSAKMKKQLPRPFSIIVDVSTLDLLNKIAASTSRAPDAIMFAALKVYQVYLGQGNAFMASRVETAKRGGRPKPLKSLVGDVMKKVQTKGDSNEA